MCVSWLLSNATCDDDSGSKCDNKIYGRHNDKQVEFNVTSTLHLYKKQKNQQ